MEGYDMPHKSSGQIAYEAYCARVEWRSVKGDSLPQWDDQTDALHDAWQAAAVAAINDAMKQVSGE